MDKNIELIIDNLVEEVRKRHYDFHYELKQEAKSAIKQVFKDMIDENVVAEDNCQLYIRTKDYPQGELFVGEKVKAELRKKVEGI